MHFSTCRQLGQRLDVVRKPSSQNTFQYYAYLKQGTLQIHLLLSCLYCNLFLLPPNSKLGRETKTELLFSVSLVRFCWWPGSGAWILRDSCIIEFLEVRWGLIWFQDVTRRIFYLFHKMKIRTNAQLLEKDFIDSSHILFLTQCFPVIKPQPALITTKRQIHMYNALIRDLFIVIKINISHSPCLFLHGTVVVAH